MSILSRPTRQIPVILLLILALMAVLLLVSPWEPVSAPWQHFDLLVVPRDDNAAALRALLEAEGERVLQRDTALLEVEDFRGRRTLTVAELYQTFEMDDPRLDPFILSLDELFTAEQDGEEREVLYLAAPSPPQRGFFPALMRYRHLQRLLRGYSFTLAGWNVIPGVLRSAGAFLLILGAFVLVRFRRWPALAVLVPTVVYATLAGPAGMVRAGLPALLWVFLQASRLPGDTEFILYRSRPERERERQRHMIIFMVAVLVGAATLWLEPPAQRLTAILAYVVFLISLGALSRLVFLVTVLRVQRHEHRLFWPRPILTTGASTECVPPRTEVLLTSVFLVVVLLSLLLPVNPASDVILPTPTHYSDNATDPALLLTELSLVPLERKPLSSAGYVAHRRYQETMLYGGVFAVPRDAEVLELTRFSRQDGRLQAFGEEVFAFDASWLESIFDPDPQFVYVLFADEQGVFAVAPQPDTGTQVSPSAVPILLLAILLVLGALLISIRLPYRSGIDTVGAVLGRGRQEI